MSMEIKCLYEPLSYDEAIEEWAWIWIEKRKWIATPPLLFALKERLKQEYPEENWIPCPWKGD